jgi:hypothetical protein
MNITKKITSRIFIKRFFLGMFLFIVISSVIIESLPKPSYLRNKIRYPISLFLDKIGFKENWSMFCNLSPNNSIQVIVETESGKKIRFYRMYRNYSIKEKLLNEKFIIFATYHLSYELGPQDLRHVAKWYGKRLAGEEKIKTVDIWYRAEPWGNPLVPYEKLSTDYSTQNRPYKLLMHYIPNENRN